MFHFGHVAHALPTRDGVHSFVDELAPLLIAATAPQDVAEEVAAAIAQAGEPDNHTIVVADLA